MRAFIEDNIDVIVSLWEREVYKREQGPAQAKEKTYSQNERPDKFWLDACESLRDNRFWETKEPKEKTYSQADMDKADVSKWEKIGEYEGKLCFLKIENEQLKNEITKISKDFWETKSNLTERCLIQNEKIEALQESNGAKHEIAELRRTKIIDLERENKILKVRNSNLELCDKFVCGCETVVWVNKGDADRILCPQCESWMVKER